MMTQKPFSIVSNKTTNTNNNIFFEKLCGLPIFSYSKEKHLMSDFIPTGSLEQMGISVETNLPEGVLTPAYAKGVKFTQTKPGYHFREVEAYKESVDYTLESYAQLLHNRDLDVHRLGGELDRAFVDIKNLQNQIEVFEFKGGVAQANADDSEISTLLDTNEQLRLRITQIENEKAVADKQIAELNAWADSVTEYVATLEAKIANPAVAPEVESVQPSPEVEVPHVTEPVELVKEDELLDTSHNSSYGIDPVTPEAEISAAPPSYQIPTPAPAPASIPAPVATPAPAYTPTPSVPPVAFPGITEDDLR